VVIFYTTTKISQKVAEEKQYMFKFTVNKCAQAGNNKVFALVADRDSKPALLTWTKGATDVTILAAFSKTTTTIIITTDKN